MENSNLADPSSGNPAAASVLGTVRALDPNLKTPYVMNYSFSIQRELPRGFFLEAAYVGNQQRHLTRTPDINMPAFSLLSANYSLPTAKQAALNSLRPYKGYSSILMRLSDGNGNYNALQLYLTKRKGWFTSTVSYTFSKNLAEASSESETSEDPFNRRLNYGPTSFDRRSIFSMSFNAALPRLANRPLWQRTTVGGWNLSGIVHAQTGGYFSVTSTTALGTWRADYIGGDVSVPSPTPSLLFNTTAFGTPPVTRYGNSGSGIVEGPGLDEVDLSVAKQFSLTERVSMRLQADAFNILNHPNFTSFTTQTTSLSFGAATAASPGRQLQLGVKLSF